MAPVSYIRARWSIGRVCGPPHLTTLVALPADVEGIAELYSEEEQGNQSPEVRQVTEDYHSSIPSTPEQ